ncbi:MAG: lipid-A-disaccharide synthase [Oculatellaceae cyanobacterium bins.114]|nr:lipid-A-disaccharide synthase [Oculatellaceae cyanobacterium bins.114]
MKVRLFISTGEVSGDLQGALLVEALKKQATQQGLDLEIVALGGDRMARAGAVLLSNTTAIGSIGLIESLPYVLPTLQIQRQAKQYLQQYPPDLVVLIDYLGPNLSLGTYIKRHLPQIPVVYYIAPQEWVWSINSRNTQQIIGITDRLLAIFPEEARYYQQRGASVTHVGHPLLDRLQNSPNREQARATLGIDPEQTAIALIPASRRQELKYLVPVIFQAAQQIQSSLPHVHFWIPLSLEVYRHPLEQAIQHYGLRATVITNDSPTVIAAADLAIAKSGTVNLEIALAQVPQIVLYRVSPVTAWILKHLLRFSVPFISPPNLVLMEAIVPEFMQAAATPENVVQTALALLKDESQRQQMVMGYQRMRQAMGEPGVCDRAAQEILGLLAHPTPASLQQP